MANALQQPEVDPSFVNEDARRIIEQHRTEKERHKQSLNLQRENIL